MPRKKYLEAGRIVATHGIKGEVKVQPWCDSPQVLCNLSVLYFDNGKTPVKVGARPHKNAVIMKIEGVNSAQDAGFRFLDDFQIGFRCFIRQSRLELMYLVRGVEAAKKKMDGVGELGREIKIKRTPWFQHVQPGRNPAQFGLQL